MALTRMWSCRGGVVRPLSKADMSAMLGLEGIVSKLRNLCAPVTYVIRRTLFGELLHPRTVGQNRREDQMGKTGLFAASAAALIVACMAGWAASNTQARVATPTTIQIDPLAMMTSAKQLPTQHFADYSFVF
jgi:hypothetical protein